MSDIERIERRLSALERAVVDGDPEVAALEDLASLAAELEAAVERLEAHDCRLADLEGRVDALEGAVGGGDAADVAVERRANAADVAVERRANAADVAVERRANAAQRGRRGGRPARVPHRRPRASPR
ncbi:hypothetical protein HTG_16515 [Natrinema mahii]|nr:hypothetical protein HTG_16515 [Natrinema mahii]